VPKRLELFEPLEPFEPPYLPLNPGHPSNPLHDFCFLSLQSLLKQIKEGPFAGEILLSFCFTAFFFMAVFL